jgi:hypothetical protein
MQYGIKRAGRYHLVNNILSRRVDEILEDGHAQSPHTLHLFSIVNE